MAADPARPGRLWGGDESDEDSRCSRRAGAAHCHRDTFGSARQYVHTNVGDRPESNSGTPRRASSLLIGPAPIRSSDPLRSTIWRSACGMPGRTGASVVG